MGPFVGSNMSNVKIFDLVNVSKFYFALSAALSLWNGPMHLSQAVCFDGENPSTLGQFKALAKVRAKRGV